MKTEKAYDFLERRRQIHTPNRRDPAAQPAGNEAELDSRWTLSAEPVNDPLLGRAARDLQDYLHTSHSLSLRLAAPGEPVTQGPAITLSADPARGDLGRGDFALDIGRGGIRITASEPRGAWFGALRLEDLMNLREAPFLECGSSVSRPLVARREVHSGAGIDAYPDSELNAIAHAGFNTIKVFLKGLDRNAVGWCNLNDLIRRAAGFGLDVAFYNYMPSFKHPDEPDAAAFFDSIYGEVFRRYPDAAGISLCGESLEFPSRDPATTGKTWRDSVADGIPDVRPSPGWWPCRDYGDYLKAIERAIHAVKPDAEVSFSTYNWGYADDAVRRRFLEKILPENIGLRVPFEVFTRKRLKGLSCPVMDYTASETEGSHYFKTECAVAHRRGIPVTVTTNTCGATWDFGTAPYVPAPYKWIARIRALRQACKDWTIHGFYETHHYGWEPNVVIELAKFSFRNPGEDDLEGLLDKLAVRDYGREAAPQILKAWRFWSDAMDHYVASNEDQYGPWRVGPAYPFIFHPSITRTMAPKEIAFPAAESAMFGGLIVKTFYQPYENADQAPGPLRYPAELEALETMQALWTKGLEQAEQAAAQSPPGKRDAGERLAALGLFIRNSIATVIHIKRWWLLNIALQASGNRAGSLAILDRLDALATAEIANAERTIPAVERDSRLGWEPSMEYVCDRWHLEWKIRQVRSALSEIATYRNCLNL